jgi:hypothetical protein
MTVIEVATAKARPHPSHESDLEMYVCAAHYVHPRERDVWSSVGAGDTEEDARQDLVSLLRDEGIEAPIQLSECVDKKKRQKLIWSAKSRAMMYGGFALVVVEE